MSVSENISPGVVIVTKFDSGNKKVFAGFINYLERPDALENNLLLDYENYVNGYMDNPDKSKGIFTNSKESLNEQDLIKLKECYTKAQVNGSLLWQTVISFDNKFLEENGIYDPDKKFIDEKKLQNVTKGCMNRMLDKEGLNNAIWSAAIHYNTDNIHIHIATVEPIPMRQKIVGGLLDGQYKGKWKSSTLTAGKSFVANNIIENHINERINQIIRDNIIEGKKKHPIIEDKEFFDLFVKIHSTLPVNKRDWVYDLGKNEYFKPDLNKLTSMYIEKYHKGDYQELLQLLDRRESEYTRAYGGEENNYAENKIDDLNKRMGNVILKEMKEYDKNLKKINYDKMKEERLNNNTRENRTSTNMRGVKANSSGKMKFLNRESLNQAMRNVDHLKYMLQKEYKNIRNQYEYELMQQEAERENKVKSRSNEIDY